jgi:hypothetical protein
MTKSHKILLLFIILGFYSGCSQVKFSLDDSKCRDNGCIIDNGKYSFKYSTVSGVGKVDILIVNDNSASMSFEQARVAPRFQNFIKNLDDKKIDYRIAITTTDVSGGAFPQGGNLIPFGDGSAYLHPANQNRSILFNAAINRPETLSCETFIAEWFRSHDLSSRETNEYQSEYQSKCPSGDERGVYSANLVIKNNPSNFIRPDSHLSIIFLSDEDERSGLYANPIYSLETLDQPKTLVENVKDSLGLEKYNSLSIHSIIVKDTNCLNIQNNQTLGTLPSPHTKGLMNGSIGGVYLKFTESLWGVAADICADNYTNQLGLIQTRMENAIKEQVLNCKDPSELVVILEGKPIEYFMEGKLLKFSALIPAGSRLDISYKCNSI